MLYYNSINIRGYRMKLLYFDLAATVILALLLFTTIFRGLTKGRLNRCFIELLVVGLFSAVADVFAAYFDNTGLTNLNVRYLTHYTYLLIHSSNTPFVVIYLMIVSDTDYKLRRFKSILYTLPFAAVVACLIVNPFTGIVFDIDSNYVYNRGPFMFVLYAAAFIYVLVAFYYLIRYGKTIGVRRALGIGSVIPMMLAANIIQFFQPQLLLEMFAYALSMLLVSSLIHRPEDILDIETGFSNKSACIDDVDRCIKNKKPLDVIIINISNFDTLKNLFTAGDIRNLHKTFTQEIDDINRTQKVFSEMFHISGGIYCLEMNYNKLQLTADIAAQINDTFQNPFLFNGLELKMMPYVCIAKCPQDIPDGETLVRFATEIVSNDYTGAVLPASDVFKKTHYDLMRNMDNIIENAITNHLFHVYYQPIYSIEHKCFNSAEALIRLIDPNYGFIPPDMFIPVAEKSGAIHRIGAYVLDEVCSFIASPEFKELGMDYIEVNLSVAQCMRSNLNDEILGIMKKHNVDSSQINLEITETTASTSQEALQENVKQLQDAGISFSLDDYGTGYSNIDRISALLFDIVKLDKAFVNVPDNGAHDIVLNHTVSMIKELGMKIVVEGVETEDLLNRFVNLGCDYIQGYYFSKPIPKDEFVKFVKSKNA